MIYERIKDALILWNEKSIDGACISILIAVAATARKRYPRSILKKDKDAYQKFILDEMGIITGGPDKGVKFYFNGNYKVPLERILYEFLRCKLIHEGALPTEFDFTEPVIENGKKYNVLNLHGLVVGIPIGWIWNLARATVKAPENKEEFIGQKIVFPSDYPENAGLKLDYPDEDPARTGIDNI
jgi:hypothetical protein